MSNKDYYAQWLKIKEQFATALAEDVRVQEFAIGFVGVRPQATAVELVARVYCKYCDLYNKMCDIYDQSQQPQRQQYIKKVIDALACRLMELKSILEDIEVFEYTYPENALQQLLMVPQDIEILCPFFYPFEIRQKEIQYIVDQILAGNRLGDPTPTPSEIERREEERLEEERIKQEAKDAEIKRKLALGEDILDSEPSILLSPKEMEEMRLKKEHDQHVLNIQRMDRARVVIRDKVQKYNKDVNLYLDLANLRKPRSKEPLRERAGCLISKMYKRYMELKRKHVRDLNLKTKLGMVITSYQPPSEKIQLEKVREIRREFRHKYYDDWLQMHIKEKTRIFRLREGDIMQDISDEIRQWWWEWYKDCRNFDEFPYPEEGGSILVVRGETFTTDEFIEWRIAEEKRIKKEAQNPKSKEDIKAEKLAAKEEKRRLAQEAREREKKRIADYKKQRFNPDTDPGIYFRIGTTIEPLQTAWDEYENQWKGIDTTDPTLDVIKGYIMNLIAENCYQEIQLELRPIVDEMMRLELVSLKNALKLECQLTGVPLGLCKKRKKPKKVKPPKPEKTAPAVLFQRLVDRGIVKKYPRITLDEFWGDKNYAGADMRAIPWTPVFPPPCIGDVKEQVRVRCLLTLGCSCPNAKRTQLLVGPKNSGKKSLAYAIATETNSILIDLSPMNVYNKFPGKGLKQMFHLVNKVSRIMQPTVILVDNADKLFYKKVPKEEKEFDPTRLSKDFFKEIVKGLKRDDKILVIGTATEPWLSKAKPMSKAFPQVILIPRTDYASISFILTKLLMKYHGIDREFNVHSLAQALRGFDINIIRKAVEAVLTGDRIKELGYKPLEPMEIVNAVLSSEEAVYTDNEDAEIYKQWYLSYTPWGEKFFYYLTMLQTQYEFKLKADKKKKKAQP